MSHSEPTPSGSSNATSNSSSAESSLLPSGSEVENHNKTEARSVNNRSSSSHSEDTFAVRLHEGSGEDPSSSSVLASSPTSNEGSTEANMDPYTQVMYRLVDLLAKDSAPQQEEQPPKISFEKVIGILRRRWLPMMAMFVIGVVAVAWSLRPARPVYMATTTVLLPKSNISDVLIQLSGAPQGDSNARSSTDTQIAVMTSPEVISRSLLRLSPELRERGWGSRNAEQANVSATSTVSDDLIDISVVSLDVEASRILANTVADVYMLRMREMESKSQEANIQFLGQKVREVQKSLGTAQQELKDYREKTGVFDITAQLSSNAIRLQELEQKAQAAAFEARAGAAAASVASDVALTGLQSKAEEAQARYTALLRDFLPTSDRVQRAAEEAATARQAVSQRKAMLIASLQSNARNAQAELLQARRQSTLLPAAEFKLNQLKSRVDSLESTYKAINDRYTSLNLSRNARTQTPTILRPAVAQNISGTFGRKALLMSALCALVLSILLALLLEWVDETVHSADDLDVLMHIPVLGVLPFVKNYDERRLTHMTHSDAKVRMLEACYDLQSNVMRTLNHSTVRSIAITSSTPSEGKSLCALNMAASLALGSWKVLLIDCDFWRPAQHVLNDLSLSPGYSDVLAGQELIENAVKSTTIKNLWVMPAGKMPAGSNVADLLSSPVNRRLLENLKLGYDIIVIDSPPALSVSAAQVLTSLADGVILVVSASTPQGQIQRAQASLRLTGGNLLGVIFNKSKNRSSTTQVPTSQAHKKLETPFSDYEKLLEESARLLVKQPEK